MNCCNILVSSVGRRCQLISCLRQSAERLGMTALVIGIDASVSPPARFLVDRFYQVPRCTEPGFIDVVRHICETENIRLLVPTIDTELAVYAEAGASLGQAGATVAISHPDTVAIAADKVKANAWLRAHNFPTVRQAPARAAAGDESWRFPVILKPRNGSASVDVHVVASADALRVLSQSREDFIVEERAAGREFTVNVYVNREGRALCAVPHLRADVRAGEVSKAVTIRDPQLVQLGMRLGEELPGAFGPLNVQVFVDGNGCMKVTEINARFGGGYPLAHRAGAEMTTWLLREALGLSQSAVCDNWESGLAMLRFDDAVFVSSNAVPLCL